MPAMLFAANVPVLASPDAFDTPVIVFVVVENTADAPAAGAVYVTLTPWTGLLFTFLTSDTSGLAKFCPVFALWLLPLETVMLTGASSSLIVPVPVLVPSVAFPLGPGLLRLTVNCRLAWKR